MMEICSGRVHTDAVLLQLFGVFVGKAGCSVRLKVQVCAEEQ